MSNNDHMVIIFSWVIVYIVTAQGDVWLEAELPVSSTATSLSFIVTRGGDHVDFGPEGDIALDDFSLSNGACGSGIPGTTPAPTQAATTTTQAATQAQTTTAGQTQAPTQAPTQGTTAPASPGETGFVL